VLYEGKTRPTFLQCCVLAGVPEPVARKEKHQRSGGSSRKPKPPPPDLVTQALLILRQATAEQRKEIVRRYGTEALWAVIEASLEPRHAGNGAAPAEPPTQLCSAVMSCQSWRILLMRLIRRRARQRDHHPPLISLRSSQRSAQSSLFLWL
jgi:hypothetical protein